LLEVAQVIDETAVPPPKDSPEARHADGQKAAHRLATLHKRGVNFVVELPRQELSLAEGWGTEVTKEVATFMHQILPGCQELAKCLEAGPLAYLEAQNIDHRLVLLPRGDTSFLIAWPLEVDGSRLMEQSNQLITSWDS